MSIVPPTTPVVPAIRPFPWDNVPYTNVTPLTIRDNATMQWEMERVKEWIRDTLVPHVDESNSDLVAAWANNVTQLIAGVNANLDAHDEEVAERLADNLTAVNTIVTGFDEHVTEKQGEFDTFAATVISDEESAAHLAFHREFGSFISVLSKGAVLDGVADDAPAINAALSTAATFGVGVYQPAGIARIASQLIPRSGVIWRGEGGRSIIQATTDFGGAAIGAPAEGLENFTLRDITIDGRTEDANTPMIRDRERPTSFSQAIRMIGDRYTGVVPGDTNEYPRIRNILLDNVQIVNTYSLPFYFAGIENVRVVNSFIRNTMDAGFVYCDGVQFNNNRVENSADNGVSVSRRCVNVTVADNVITGSAHYGLWCAGFYSDADGGLYDPGPENFTISGNVIIDSGKGGIALSDAPKNGTVTGNTIRNVWNGNADYPSVNDGTGIFITGYPTQNSTPDILAENIVIAGNLLQNVKRNGVGIRGAQNITLNDNTFIDIGVENFIADYAPAGIVAGTPISTTSISYNCGIITSGTGLQNFSVIDNTFIDTRATGVSNYAIPSNVRSTPGFYESGNRAINYRQPIGKTVETFGENSAPGFAVKVNAGGGSNRDIVFQAAGQDRWIFRAATDNSLQFSRRAADGSQVDIPISLSWSTGQVSFNTVANFQNGLYVGSGQTITAGTDGMKILGSGTSKLGFYGATPTVRPDLTYSRTGETVAENQLRLALVALGLVGNLTVP